MTGTTGRNQAQHGANVPHGDNPVRRLDRRQGALGYADTTLDINTAICVVTANSPTIALPSAVGISGRVYWIKNRGPGTVTIAAATGQTIDGRPTLTEDRNGCYQVVSHGANWVVLGSY